ncbi:MAG: sigma-E factor regulatory protein RseB domain-containing protein [Bacillota bacterium]|nr:sigma-E factor regulatory protein RseB domain-containing protein [Bacillota bacterium]
MNKPSPEQELDNFIDAINQERRPNISDDPEINNIQSIARLVKSLRTDSDPQPEFVDRLYKTVNSVTDHGLSNFKIEEKRNRSSRRTFFPWAALVAGILVLAQIVIPWPFQSSDVVFAMAQKVQQLQNYHAVLEKVSTNSAGQSTVYQRVEIWSEGDKYATRSDDGTMNVNNGEQHWSVEAKQKQVIILPLLPATHDFDLHQEADRAVTYPHKVVGQDSIAGRNAKKIEISPPGGMTYYLWVDGETNLPVQLQTAMQKAVQTTYTFVSFEPNTQIPTSIFSYKPPQGYIIINQNQDEPVANLDEAVKISGIKPVQASENPQRIFANKGRIVFDFGDTIVTESTAGSPIVLSPTAALGQAAGGSLEVLPNSLRWQQNGLEIKVQGSRAEQLARQLTDNLTMPQQGQGINQAPQVKVNVDMDVQKNNQQQVDAGSSPWQLDPVQVAFTFVAVQMSPQGITSKPPLDYSELKMTTNTGSEAIVLVQKGPIKTVYLKRLVRQDNTGIWTVVGYDPR